MKHTNEKVYRCDHCNKVGVSVGLMVIHERMCKQNPNNQHQCFKYCNNLVKNNIKEDVYDEDTYCGFNHVEFTCAAQPEIKLYSYKLERYKSNLHRLKGKTRMPLKCEFYETMVGHDYSDEDDSLNEQWEY